jgi:hypothetical protein
MWPAFPTSDYYGGSVPSLTNNRRRACPPPAWTAGGEGGRRTVPTFTINRSTGSVPSYSPAASPRVRRSPSPWPPGRQPQPASESPPILLGRRALLPGPDPPDFEPVSLLRGFHHWFLQYVHLPVLLAGPEPSGSTDPSRRCRGCSHPPLRLQGQAAPSFTGLLRQPRGGPSIPPGQMAPRGARGCREKSPSSLNARTGRSGTPACYCSFTRVPLVHRRSSRQLVPRPESFALFDGCRLSSPRGQIADSVAPRRRATAALYRQLGTVAQVAPLGEYGSAQGRGPGNDAGVGGPACSGRGRVDRLIT